MSIYNFVGTLEIFIGLIFICLHGRCSDIAESRYLNLKGFMLLNGGLLLLILHNWASIGK